MTAKAVSTAVEHAVQYREAIREATERARLEGRGVQEVLDEDRALADAKGVIENLAAGAADAETKLITVTNQFRHEAAIALGARGESLPLGATLVPWNKIHCDKLRDHNAPHVAAGIEAIMKLLPAKPEVSFAKIVPLALVLTASGAYLIKDGRVRYMTILQWALHHGIDLDTLMIPAFVVEGDARSALAGFFRRNEGLNGVRALGITKEERKRGAWMGFDLKLSNGVIAKIVGMSTATIANWRKTYTPPPFGTSQNYEEDLVWGLTGPKHTGKIGSKTQGLWDEKKKKSKVAKPAKLTANLQETEELVEVLYGGKPIGTRSAVIRTEKAVGGTIYSIRFPYRSLPKVEKIQVRRDGTLVSVTGGFVIEGQDECFDGQYTSADLNKAK